MPAHISINPLSTIGNNNQPLSMAFEKHKKCTKLKIAKKEEKSGLTAFEMSIEKKNGKIQKYANMIRSWRKSVKLPWSEISWKTFLKLYTRKKKSVRNSNSRIRLHVWETLTTMPVEFFLQRILGENILEKIVKKKKKIEHACYNRKGENFSWVITVCILAFH